MIEHKCHQNVTKWNDSKGRPCAMCSVCKRVIVVVRRMFLQTVSRHKLMRQPVRYCESYGHWVWVVFYPGKRPDSMTNHFAAISHANYVSRNPIVMQPQE